MATLLTGEMERQLPLDAKEDAKETLAKRQANAAVALLRRERPEKVWPLLKHSPDPRVRSYLIHRLSPLGADVLAIVKRLEEESDESIRRALVVSLGDCGEKEAAPAGRGVVVEKLREFYRKAADPGLHGAAEWLLRQWKQDQWLKQIDEEWRKDKQGREQRLERIRQELAQAKGAAQPQWYVNGQGQTLVVLPGPVEFQMGSPPTEAGRSSAEPLHRQRIGRTFALATKPVTLEQFLWFRKDYDYLPKYAPTADCPVYGMTWYMAAAYCNWLSKQEGIAKEDWCYEPETSKSVAFVASTTGLMGSPAGQGPLLAGSLFIPERTASGEYAEGMKLAPDYLKRRGYRLPTEAEWEYACRAGAVTSRYYGESEELLGKYAWYLSNSGTRSWPVASLKPNDLGLFDMHSNVWTWCQDRYKSYVGGQGGRPKKIKKVLCM